MKRPKTIEEFMKSTGVSDQATLLQWLIDGFNNHAARQKKIREVMVQLEELGFSLEDIEKFIDKLPE